MSIPSLSLTPKIQDVEGGVVEPLVEPPGHFITFILNLYQHLVKCVQTLKTGIEVVL